MRKRAESREFGSILFLSLAFPAATSAVPSPFRFFSYFSSMSRPSKSPNPSSSLQSIQSRSKLQDPLSTLPREVLLFVLFSLSPFSIAHASAINRRWRRFIHSEPSLFSTVDLTYGRGMDGEEEMMEELEMTKLIGRLIRFSSLSNHKLKNVSLDMCSFHQDLVFTEEEKAGSRLVTLFQVLNLSNTLSKLYLQAPTFDKSDTEIQED